MSAYLRTWHVLSRGAAHRFDLSPVPAFHVGGEQADWGLQESTHTGPLAISMNLPRATEEALNLLAHHLETVAALCRAELTERARVDARARAEFDALDP